jgi:PPOX class probable F420-dependent enzyme
VRLDRRTSTPRAGVASGASWLASWFVADFPETHADLLDAPVGTLGTIDSEGRPQLTEVWFLHDDGELKLWLNDRRAKVRNLRERPACSLLILDLGNPRRYLEVRGRARVTADPDRAFAPKLGATYGMDLSRLDPPGELRVVVTIEPEKVYAVDMSR